MSELVNARLADREMRSDLSAGTKDLYRREPKSLVLPTFKAFRLREITTTRLDQFLKRQAKISYAHARHSRVALNSMFNHALRQDALHHNPVRDLTRLKQPITTTLRCSHSEMSHFAHPGYENR